MGVGVVPAPAPATAGLSLAGRVGVWADTGMSAGPPTTPVFGCVIVPPWRRPTAAATCLSRLGERPLPSTTATCKQVTHPDKTTGAWDLKGVRTARGWGWIQSAAGLKPAVLCDQGLSKWYTGGLARGEAGARRQGWVGWETKPTQRFSTIHIVLARGRRGRK